jgi:hypothetical protein
MQRPFHPDEQAAGMQCVPMAIANNLQWLENAYGLNVPHPHQMGLLNDGSLVGELDRLTGRQVTNRAQGGGVMTDRALQGKMQYIAANNLGGHLRLLHQYPLHPGWRGLQANQALNLAANQMVGGVTSAWYGEPTIDFIITSICSQAAVEVLYTSTTPVYGHAVQIVRAGKIQGVPFVFHLSDLKQANEPGGDLLGTGFPQFSYLYDTADADFVPNFVNTFGVPNAVLVMSAVYVP